ncbi:MAG: rhodanese-like domain-containing protein [Chitinophagaceae bacterium]|nr:rhodanese-like domain-containing protein [Chitinophagaceae bacterium]MCB9045535.1 rhodanese-like domain-containing protein [Chitinophagales bacterium]
MSIKEIIKQEGTVIIDVRSPMEFSGGSVADSINIPLQELPGRISELKQQTGNIVLCCASGGRSGIATQLLQGQGFSNVYNGGGWTDVNYWKNN